MTASFNRFPIHLRAHYKKSPVRKFAAALAQLGFLQAGSDGYKHSYSDLQLRALVRYPDRTSKRLHEESVAGAHAFAVMRQDRSAWARLCKNSTNEGVLDRCQGIPIMELVLKKK